MKRVRSGIKVGLALAALITGAQSTAAGQLNLLPILTISGQHSDNVFFDDDNQQSDTFFLVNPGIALDYASNNFVGSIGYQLGLQRYTDFEDRDNTVHRIDVSAGFNLSKGVFIDATDNLYVTNDPLAFDASGDRLQRDSFTYNRFVPSVSYVFGSRDVRVAARYDRVDVDYETLTDSEQNGFGVTASGKLGGRSTATLDFTSFERKFSQQSIENNLSDYKGRRYGVRVDRRFSPRFSGNVFLGYEDREFEINPTRNNFDSFIFDLSASGEFPEIFSWTAGFSQHLNDLATQGAYKVRRFTYDIRKSIQERLRLEFGGYVQDSNNEQIPEDAGYIGFRLEGQYLVAKFLNVWLGYEYIDRDGGDTGDIQPFNENRVNFGLTLSYGI